MPRTFKPQDLRDVDGRPWDRTLCFDLSMADRSRTTRGGESGKLIHAQPDEK